MADWSLEELAQLKAMKAAKEPLSVICKALGRTKGSVCGQWNRMNGYVVPKTARPPTRSRSDPTAWTEASLTERWADRKKRK